MSSDARRGAGPLLVVISGPSGAGKDSVLARMKEQPLPYHYAVTATTRPMREHESNGREYIFVSKDEFRRMIADDELLEWAEVYGEMYGVPRAQVTGAHARGQDAIVKVDVQGAATIRQLAPEADAGVHSAAVHRGAGGTAPKPDDRIG